MPIDNLTEADITKEIDAAHEHLRNTLGQVKSSKGLKLTGLEVLGFLSAKLVLPVFCGFVSRVLYDRYKDLQTKKKAEQAEKDILAQQNTPRERVDESIIRSDLSAMLILEGIAEDQAAQIVEKVIQRVKAKFPAS